jgi:hypothetical protein
VTAGVPPDALGARRARPSRRVAILIAASPTDAFYSQVAALAMRLRALTWSRWQPSIHVHLGGDRDSDTYADWRPYLRDVEIVWTSETRFALEGDWAQSDDAFRFAPRDVDLLVAMDADSFPIADLEPLFDRVLDTGAVAGVIAHYPTVLDFIFDRATMEFVVRPGSVLRHTWARLAEGLITAPLDFAYAHTLMDPASAPELRLAPFYLNFGVVLFPRAAFDEVAPRYLALRPEVMRRMASVDFSGQAALTLAIADTGVRTWALPLRYNFPNDARAEQLYPDELAQAAIIHYLRTTAFDRHEIFARPDSFASFLKLPLAGANGVFRDAVEATFGSAYPFTRGGSARAPQT